MLLDFAEIKKLNDFVLMANENLPSCVIWAQTKHVHSVSIVHIIYSSLSLEIHLLSNNFLKGKSLNVYGIIIKIKIYQFLFSMRLAFSISIIEAFFVVAVTAYIYVICHHVTTAITYITRIVKACIDFGNIGLDRISFIRYSFDHHIRSIGNDSQ